jgi:hypothetical protein
MRFARAALVILAVVALVGASGSARAEGTACGAETTAVADGRIFASTIPNANTFWFIFQTRVGRSYTVEAQFTGTAGAFAPTIALFGGTALCAGTPQLTATDTTSVDPGLPLTGVRKSFTAADAGNTGLHRISLTNSSGSSQSYTLKISETTMFSPAWSTSPGYVTYYSFFNTTNATITGTITLTKTDGTAAGSTTLNIPTGQTSATNTVALATPSGGAGTAKFTHNGPPGAILVESDIANFNLAGTPYIQPVKFQAARE